MRVALFYLYAAASDKVISEMRTKEGRNDISVESSGSLGMDVKIAFLYTKLFKPGSHCIAWSEGVANIFRITFTSPDEEHAYGDALFESFPTIFSYGITSNVAFYF